MIPEEIENIKDKQLTEKDLDALYFYLYMNMDSMGDTDKILWTEILKKIDKQFYDDSSDGSTNL